MVAGLPKVFEYGALGVVLPQGPGIHSDSSSYGNYSSRLRCLRRVCWQSIALRVVQASRQHRSDAASCAGAVGGGGQRPPPRPA